MDCIFNRKKKMTTNNIVIFFFLKSELNLICLLKAIFEALAAREFHGLACFDSNRFAG